MSKLLYRVFPTRPFLGVTLVALLLAEAGIGVAFAWTKLGTGYAVEGTWRLLNQTPTACMFKHNPDEWTSSDGGNTVLSFANGHWSTCTRQKVGNEVCADFVKPDTCTGETPNGIPDQDHITEK